MHLNPRTLILSLILGAEARGDTTLGARELLAACSLFNLPENAVRVALARAVTAQLLVTPNRGRYALGPQARPLALEVSRWRRTESLMTEWKGNWIAVHVGATGRSDRSALRARERAFGLLGLAEFERGLYLRPDNLIGGAPALRARLQALLPPDTEAGTLFLLSNLTAQDEKRACCLWDTTALNATYSDITTRLSAWLDGAHTLPLDQAAREAFEIGHDAIRQLMYDPLLPAPLVDAKARTRFMMAIASFDDNGKDIWQRFLAVARSRGPLSSPPSSPYPFTHQETTS